MVNSLLLFCSGELSALVHVAAVPQPHRGPLCQGANQTKIGREAKFLNFTYKAHLILSPQGTFILEASFSIMFHSPKQAIKSLQGI